MDMVKTGGSRVASIDALRAITMMLMLFVNDIPGLKGVPHWLFHARADEDMLGFSDTIFPAFLFCVGMSVPFAIEQRLRKGDSPLRVLAHILWRGVALIVMGVFTYNLERDLSCISYLWFSLLMIAGFFLIWTDYRHTILSDKPVLTNFLKALGISILVGMMMWCHYCGECFETGWWGILGLIGWSYLVTSLIYLVCRLPVNKTVMVAGLAILTAVLWFVPNAWSGHALCIAGLLASLLMRYFKQKVAHIQLIIVCWAIGFVMLVAGIVSHPYWIISKIQGTPTWVFFCLAIYFPLASLLYWLMDVKGHTAWTWLIAPAGTATLTCYLLPYVWYPVSDALGVCFPEGWWYGVTGIILSLAYSLIVIQVTRLLMRLGLIVRL